jgi:hypothetical protein
MKRYVLFLFLLLPGLFGARNHTTSPSTPVAITTVLTQHNDNQRTGANLNETILNTSNVRSGSFGKLFTRVVDGHIYAQPLYISGVNVPNKGIHNVVYVATQHNSVYAFDADYPLLSAPLWKVNLGPSAPVPADFGNNNKWGTYKDIEVEVGITGTPVIDPGTNTLYVVTFIRDPNQPVCDLSHLCTYHHYLHALAITTGVEKLGGPVLIAGSVPGTGFDSQNGMITFDSHQQLQRPSLLLSNGIVYVGFGSYADTDPYHGWLFGYNAATLARVAIYNSTPNAVLTPDDPYPGEGGIWQSGEGPSVDSNGYVYLVTGNGSFDGDTNKGDYGDTVLKLDPQNIQNGLLPVSDWFTPYNQYLLSQADHDLGSMGVLLIPGTDYLVTGGKQGVLYLIDKTKMTHYNGPNGPDLVEQSFAASPDGLFNSPVLWNRPTGRLVYLWAQSGPLMAFSFANNRFQETPVATAPAVPDLTDPGGALSLSANGSDPNTGILWASHPLNGGFQGVLHAYDASDISKELWNSDANPTGHDKVGVHAKFNAPTIANGRVYLGTTSNQLVVYGLLFDNKVFLPTLEH